MWWIRVRSDPRQGNRGKPHSFDSDRYMPLSKFLLFRAIFSPEAFGILLGRLPSWQHRLWFQLPDCVTDKTCKDSRRFLCQNCKMKWINEKSFDCMWFPPQRNWCSHRKPKKWQSLKIRHSGCELWSNMLDVGRCIAMKKANVLRQLLCSFDSWFCLPLSFRWSPARTALVLERGT